MFFKVVELENKVDNLEMTLDKRPMIKAKKRKFHRSSLIKYIGDVSNFKLQNKLSECSKIIIIYYS